MDARAHRRSAVAPSLAWIRSPQIALLAAIGVVLILQATMIFTRAINWDEFYYYAQIEDFAAGRLRTPLQTIHVQLFAWMAQLYGTSVDHIVAGRMFMFAFELVTIACIVIIARRFGDIRSALLAALAYISAGYVLQHGMSFRVDPPATACLMCALAILARSRIRTIEVVAFGLLTGIAGMITIKAGLYLPCFAGMAWLRWHELRKSGETGAIAALRIAACAIAPFACFAALYWLHSQSLLATQIDPNAVSAPDPAETTHNARNVVSTSAGDVFFFGIPPYWRMIVKSATLAPLLTLLIIVAPGFIVLRKNVSNAERVAIGALWLPILTLLFYRNTAPYYHAFMLAPVAIAIVWPIAWLRNRFGTWLIAAVLLLFAGATWAKEDRDTLSRQRTLVSAVHEMFPEPVAYFDHNGMLGDFPKANGFMTPWGLEQYHRAGIASYRAAMLMRPVPLLIENDALLTELLNDKTSHVLLSADRDALQNAYVNFWGPVWLAGKILPAESEKTSEVLVPGRYRIEGMPLTIDGQTFAVGSVTTLDRGTHRFVNSHQHDARIVWNEVVRGFKDPPPKAPLWIGF